MIWLVVLGAWVLAWIITTTIIGYARFYKPNSTMADVVGPLRLPWWAAFGLTPIIVLALLSWALAAGVGAPRVARAAALVALGASTALVAAWVSGWVGTFAVSVLFPPWLRAPIELQVEKK